MESVIELVWRRLGSVRQLSFRTISRSLETTGWAGEGDGIVEVVAEGSDVLLFKERGRWFSRAGKGFDFKNTYRWTLGANGIRLEHLRFGVARPVYLFELEESGPRSMVSSSPHVCSEDLYTATLELQDDILLRWQVTGPGTDESITYRYM
ncbi:MAG: DUF6314 family protein [Luteolibacter sp.]